MNLTNPKLLYLKALLFLFCGTIASGVLIAQSPSLKTAALLIVAIWSFARAYYFVFYVIQNYVDPKFKFSGLWAFIRYVSRGK